MTFAGACNPYKKMTKKPIDTNALIKEGSSKVQQNLVYSVNPLTYTQLYYVLNFGS